MSYRWISRAILLAWLCTAAEAHGQQPAVLVHSSDPLLVELASEILPDLARRSGMELKEPVRLERRSREELVRYLEHKLDEELPEQEAEAIVAAYALFGLVPPDLRLREMLMALYTEQVAGFYEPDSTALFVLDDQREEDLRGLLVHELVHAVQDQSANLDALTDPELGNDRATAAQAAIEGHATLVMFEYLAEQQTGMAVDLSRIPAFGTLLRQNLESVRAQFPALANAPRVLQESLIFPYVEGAVFLHRLWAGGERVVPFGEDLPLSTEEILFGPGASAPLELVVEARGGEILHEDVLGRLELGILLEQHLGAERASLADGWDGDRYVLVALPNGDETLVSYIVWDGPDSRDAFADALERRLVGFGAAAALDRLDLDGRPATRLVIGPASGIETRATLGPS